VPLLAGGLVPADQKGACASMNKIIEELLQARRQNDREPASTPC
jgi:hypothetical protein